MANLVSVSVVQGNIVVFTVTVKTPTGAALNLTGYTSTMVVKATQTSSDGTGTTIIGATAANPATGVITFTVPATVHATAGRYWYRVDVIDSFNNHVTPVYGVYTVVAA